jgi:outer membrane protein OmpA-like peptidoglycan-associated protein
MSHQQNALALFMGVGLLTAGWHHNVPPASAAARTAAPPNFSAAPRPAPPPPARAGAPSSPLSDEELFRRKSLDQLNAEHPPWDVFFDYDQTTLREDARAVLQRDAAWLTRWPDRLVLRSLGKEAPFCHDEGEACWSQNRRDHFVIVAK